MESTIKLIQKMNKTLVEVIQFLDSNGHSNTDVRKKVDTILNFTNDLKEESKKEISRDRDSSPGVRVQGQLHDWN